MWRVYADTFLGETQEGGLLGVGEGDGFERAEDDGMVGNDDTVFPLDSLIRNSLSQIDCDKSGLVKMGAMGRFEEEASVVKRLIGEFFRI